MPASYAHKTSQKNQSFSVDCGIFKIVEAAIVDALAFLKLPE
jgi:hypothetical protein